MLLFFFFSFYDFLFDMSEEGEGAGEIYILLLPVLFIFFFLSLSLFIGRSPRLYLMYVYKCTYKMMLTHHDPFLKDKQQDKRRKIYNFIFIFRGRYFGSV
jgi:hypothetical protein